MFARRIYVVCEPDNTQVDGVHLAVTQFERNGGTAQLISSHNQSLINSSKTTGMGTFSKLTKKAEKHSGAMMGDDHKRQNYHNERGKKEADLEAVRRSALGLGDEFHPHLKRGKRRKGGTRSIAQIIEENCPGLLQGGAVQNEKKP